jgi:hypothetical protein
MGNVSHDESGGAIPARRPLMIATAEIPSRPRWRKRNCAAQHIPRHPWQRGSLAVASIQQNSVFSVEYLKVAN